MNHCGRADWSLNLVSRGTSEASCASAPSSRARARQRSPRVRSTRLRKGDDPGSWNFSPEWMGTQAEGWGHNAGEVVFEGQSHHGNGQVSVTRHYASKEDPVPLHESAADSAEAKELRKAEAVEEQQSLERFQEWRVLRFNEETRQSVARVTVAVGADGGTVLSQRPDCLAFLYMKTLASAVASLVGLAPESSTLASALPDASKASLCPERCKVLCIGLGGGSLPLFLAHHFPGMDIEVVEIDPVVIKAAREAMGFPGDRSRLRVRNSDAIDWTQTQKTEGAPVYNLIVVDAFDGENDIPTPFTDPDGCFLRSLPALLDPEHGIVMVNVHRGDLPPVWKQLQLKLLGKKWMDPFVTPVAEAYRRAVIEDDRRPSSPFGVTYMLGVGRQYNTVVVAAKGRHLSDLGPDLPERLKSAAARAARVSRFRFEAGQRAVLDFVKVPGAK